MQRLCCYCLNDRIFQLSASDSVGDDGDGVDGAGDGGAGVGGASGGAGGDGVGGASDGAGGDGAGGDGVHLQQSVVVRQVNTDMASQVI